MRITLLFLLFAFPLSIFCQTSKPVPPGGIEMFFDYLYKDFDSNEKFVDKRGTIVLEFRINEKGVTDSFNIVKDLNEKVAFDLIKSIKSAGGWTPAYKNGKATAHWMKLPYELGVPRASLFISTTPEPAMGLENFKKKFLENFRYPEKAINAGIQGDFELTFDVKVDGTLSNIKILKNPGYDIEEAAIRALKRAGKWLPATTEIGKPVLSKTSFPFTLSLKEFRRHVM